MSLLRRKAGRDDGDAGKVFNFPARVVDESAFQSVSLSLSGSLRLLAVPQNIYSPDRREVLGTVSYRGRYSLYSCCILLYRKTRSAVLGNGSGAHQLCLRERRQTLYRKNPAEEGNRKSLYDRYE